MFKITVNPTFKLDVPVHVPGQADKAIVNIEFRYLDQDALKAWREKYAHLSTIDAAHELIVDWDVLDEEDAKVPYSLDALTRLGKQLQTLPNDVVGAYMKEIFGVRSKN